MKDIKANNKCVNTTGYKSLYIIPLSEVLAVNLIDKQTKEVIFAQDGSFGKVDCFDIKVQSKYEKDAYQHKITANFRSVADESVLFNSLAKNRFIVKVVDNNGQSFMYGSKSEPLRFSFEFIGNPKPSQVKEYQLTFYGETTFPAYKT
jgi:hypothetical protein